MKKNETVEGQARRCVTMKPLIFTLARILGAVLLVLLFLTACTTREERQLSALLDRADSLMRIRPDSSLYILNKVGTLPTTSLSMRHALLRADALNKCDSVLPSDTLLREVADYYDRHGSANERMRAHYLLGRCYHDMGEAPRALECYQHAAEQADTTRDDCDLHQLHLIYGQMADLYYAQYLPEDEMQALQTCERIAWKERDTLPALKAYELRLRPYYQKNDTDSILFYVNHSYQLYKKYGYHQAAGNILYMKIAISLDRGQYEEAGRYLKKYKKESGLFDNSNNIIRGREIRYYDEGRYQLGIGHVDSALYWFRRVGSYGYSEAAYKGMLDVYKQLHKPDSIAKYAELFAKANDDSYLENSMELMRIQTSLYNYHRYQASAVQMEQENSRLVIWLLSLALLLVLLATLVFFLLGYIRKRQAAVRQMKEKSARMTKGLQEVKRELELLHLMKSQLADSNSGLNDEILHLNEMIDHKEKEKNVLLGKVSFLQSKLEPSNLLAEKIEAPIVATFRRYATQVKEKPSEEEWRELCDLVDKTVPNFHAILSNNGELPPHHYRLCCLVRLGFDNTDIKVLISENLSNITMTYKNLHRKILQAPGSAKDFKNFIRRIGQEQLS